MQRNTLEPIRNDADWAKCRFFLFTSQQPMALYYIALVLHHTVIARWFRTSVDDRNTLRYAAQAVHTRQRV